jgi:hypothetical protein
MAAERRFNLTDVRVVPGDEASNVALFRSRESQICMAVFFRMSELDHMTTLQKGVQRVEFVARNYEPPDARPLNRHTGSRLRIRRFPALAAVSERLLAGICTRRLRSLK